MRFRIASLLVTLLAACSGDTFGPSAGGTAGGSSAGTGGAPPAGTGGNAGQPSTAGSAGSAGSAGAGTAGSAGVGGNGPGPGGQAGDTGVAGSASDGGAAGSPSKGGAGGLAGSAGSGTGGGPAGASGKGGAAGKSGAGGSPLCPVLPPVAEPSPACGNGVVEMLETCDDAGANGNAVDGCANCGFSCPPDWKAAGGHCYRVTGMAYLHPAVYDGPGGDGEIYDLARAAWNREPCGQLGIAGAHLAMFETVKEADDVAKAFAGILPNLGVPPWVAAGAPWKKGVSTTDKAVWKNSEGGTVPAELWGAGGPAKEERCGVFGPNGTLLSAPCFGSSIEQPRRALCESQPVCALRGTDGSTALGFVGTNGHCYAHLDVGGLTHAAAAARCASMGAHLATFEAADELAQLPGPNLTSSEVWVGATRRPCANNMFVWSTSGELVPAGQPFWGGIEPNNPQEGCATMDRNRLMGDLPCDSLKRPFCERDD